MPRDLVVAVWTVSTSILGYILYLALFPVRLFPSMYARLLRSPLSRALPSHMRQSLVIPTLPRIALPLEGRGFSTGSQDGETHFGFQTVKESEKVHLVGDVFHRVAGNYDLMNDLMSGTLHRFWKDEFVRMAGPIVSRGDRQTVLLDVAGGTGDIAFRLVDSMKRSPYGAGVASGGSGTGRPRVPPQVIVCDINPSMLGVGRERATRMGYLESADPEAPSMSFLVGDAEKLEDIPDASVDLYTIAFGIRNVTHVDKAVEQAYRVLRPGGRFMCLEFSQVTNPVLRQAYDAYSFAVIPAMGQAVAGDRASYQYLVESIRNFPDQEAFAAMIRSKGFKHVSYTNFTFGVCAVHSGFKL